jgi:Holliday junction resolvasome RuvABC endonuclease subunit
MKVLALDLATSTGWAVLDGEHVDVGTWTLDGCRGEKGEHLESLLLDAIARHRPDLIAFEEPLFFRGGGALLLVGLQFTVERICERTRTTYVSVPVSTLKLFATGSGRSKKPAMIAAARDVTGRDMNEHEADAFHVARWALASVEMEAA